MIRDRVAQRIAGREVVRDDIMILAEGDLVTADAALLECSSFTADESLLTGESIAVRKVVGLPQQCVDSSTPLQPGGDDQPYVYSG